MLISILPNVGGISEKHIEVLFGQRRASMAFLILWASRLFRSRYRRGPQRVYALEYVNLALLCFLFVACESQLGMFIVSGDYDGLARFNACSPRDSVSFFSILSRSTSDGFSFSSRQYE